MNESRKSIILFLIIILSPLFKIAEYYYNYLSESDIQFAAYGLIIIFLLLFLLVYKKTRIILFILTLYYFAYVLLPSTPWNNNAGQTIPFVLTIALLIIYSNIDISFSKKHANYLFIFTLFYMVLFYVSVMINGLTERGNRLYLDGFVISHAFSYSIIALGLFIYKYKSKLFGIITISLSITVGARSGLVLFFLTLTYIYYQSFISKRKYLVFSISITFVIIFLVQNFYIPVLDSALDTFKGIDWLNIQLFGSDKYSASFTASRSFIWNSTLFELSHRFSFSELIFGQGPLAPFIFTESIGLGYIWLHNDFFNIIYAFGILGLVLYIISMSIYYKKTKSIYAIAYMFIAAFSNGFYYYDTPLILTILTLINLNNKTT